MPWVVIPPTARGLLLSSSMRQLGHTIWALIRHTMRDWKDDDAARHAAALAYYTALSIAPLLLIAIWVAGLVFGTQTAQSEILGEIGTVTGAEGMKTIESMVESADKPQTGLIASALGIGVLLFGASGVFGELKQSLDKIWEIEPKAGGGLLGLVKERFLSMTMVLGVAFLLLVSLIVSAILAALGDRISQVVPGAPIVWQVVSFTASFVLIAVLFATIFKFLPDAEVRWKDVWIGALVTAALFIVGKLLLALYIEHADVAGKYGAAGSLVALLVWVYYSAQIFFFGAEFTQAYAVLHGSRIGGGPKRLSGADKDETSSGKKSSAKKPSGRPERASAQPVPRFSR